MYDEDEPVGMKFESRSSGMVEMKAEEAILWKNYKLVLYELINKLPRFERKKYVSLKQNNLGYFQ